MLFVRDICRGRSRLRILGECWGIWTALRWRWLLKARKLDCFHSSGAIMAFELEFDSLAVLEIVNNDLATLLGAHPDRVSICAKRYRWKRCSLFDLFDLLSIDYIVEEDSWVKASTAEQQVVHRRESDSCALVVVGLKFVSHWVLLRRLHLVNLWILMLLDDLL